MNDINIQEEWKDIKGFEGQYKISNFGRVKSVERFVFCNSKEKPNKIEEKMLKQNEDRYGYKIVSLKSKGKTYIKKVHRLVAEAFIENINGLSTVNHKDGNKKNNRLQNLEWMSNADNSRHRTINLLSKPKLEKEQIIDILENCKPAKNQYNSGSSVSAFAKKYMVQRSTISKILNRERLYLRGLLCN